MPGGRERLRAFVDFLNAENVQAAACAAPFDSPSAHWPENTHLSYGGLDVLLDRAREQLDRDPRKAQALTDLVLQRASKLVVPRDFDSWARFLLGRAWKEHGNALYQLGSWKAALEAAQLAVHVLESDRPFAVEYGAAISLEALALQQLGKVDDALERLRECRAIFEAQGETTRVLHTRLIEAGIAFERGQYAQARDLYLAIEPELADNRELASVHNNLGQCAAMLGDFEESVDYLRRAVNAFDREQMVDKRPRVWFGFGRLLARTGRRDEAMAIFENLRGDLLRRGLIVSAAEVGLDQLEILAASRAPRDRVIALARELFEIFGHAGMHRNMLVAFGYLMEQVRVLPHDAPVLQKPVGHVREFLRRMLESPEAVFAEPLATSL
ncbi:MAG TPA: tetratricopeptide repeat protein [Thermoanaerobaculia bacterium]|nr:tetratricopeptide repeat protein [Thermoanaerobaculia bacterium]